MGSGPSIFISSDGFDLSNQEYIPKHSGLSWEMEQQLEYTAKSDIARWQVALHLYYTGHEYVVEDLWPLDYSKLLLRYTQAKQFPSPHHM